MIRAGSESCPKCGLVLALWEQGRVLLPGAPPGTGPEERQAEALWRNAEQDPENEARHEAFLIHCQKTGRLDLAAHRYQAFLHRHPDSRLARSFRDRIVLLAQYQPHSARRPRRYAPRRFSGIKTVLILGLAALLWGLVMAQMFLGR